MTENNNVLRKRHKESSNGTAKRDETSQKSYDPEFAIRESPLTVLINNSLHIRAIYHIFVVILMVLLCDTVVYDLVERGKINVGITSVLEGFGDVRRGAKLWLFEFLVAISFYPCLRLYDVGVKILKKQAVLLKLWSAVGIVGLVSLQALLIAVPVWDLGRKHLALGSSVTVTCEMFRFAMKVHAMAAGSVPRCHSGATLPSFRQYLYFLFAPTLVYRDHYPRTKKIRWGFVAFNLLEVMAIIFYNSFLWERFILPYWSDYGKEPKFILAQIIQIVLYRTISPIWTFSFCVHWLEQFSYNFVKPPSVKRMQFKSTFLYYWVEAGAVVRGYFACVLPGVISFLCGFYCLLHAWLNAFAEMLTFADRLFYEEWWTTSQFSRYYRAWNRVVHSWLRDHIYRPLAPNAGRAISTFTVFFVSAVAHEVILALSFGFFYPVLLLEFGFLGLLLMPLTATSGRRYPSILNLLMWLSFFLGNGLLWSVYPMEYFARKNCPPSENDSFFRPKSWTCPEIVLKPNWTFQNPF